MEPCSRRMKALTVPAPMARPAQRSALEPRPGPGWTMTVDQLPERADGVARRCAPRPRPAAWASAASRAVTLCTTIVYCWRSSSASAKRNGSSSSWQNSLERPEERGDPAVAAGHVGRGRGVVPPGRGAHGHAAEGADGQAERRRSGPLLVGRAGCSAWSRKSRSSPFTLKISALVLTASAPEHAGVEQAVEQEGGVAGLGGHARDAADVDVGAPWSRRGSRG